MEDGLRAILGARTAGEVAVLILVLVEDGLRDMVLVATNMLLPGLNPCSCGRWSQSLKIYKYETSFCFVLILVLVEDGLRVSQGKAPAQCGELVLILVLVEDGLRGHECYITA